MNRARMVIVVILLVVLAVTLAGAFLTRGVMTYLPFLQARKGDWTGAYVPHGVVDQRPWQTAATLAALAQSAEERELAREAERLADHEVDQAFSQALRQASEWSLSRIRGSYHSPKRSLQGLGQEAVASHVFWDRLRDSTSAPSVHRFRRHSCTSSRNDLSLREREG
jgi:hypothetical protein